MNNKQAIRIPKTSVVHAGNSLGIKPNRLANYLGLEESKEIRKLEKNWEQVLPVLLEPLNFSGLIIQFEDDSLLLTNVLSNEELTAFCGSDSDDLVVLPMEPMEMVNHLASYLGDTSESKRIKQELPYDALITLLLISDSLKRMKLTNLLFPNETEFDITLDRISEEYNTSKIKDLRWLSSIANELCLNTKSIDFNNALTTLTKLGIIQYKNKLIDIDDNGIVLFDELSKHKSTIGIRSAFYHDGVLNYLTIMLLRTENHIWYFDLSDEASMMTLNTEELKGMIATMLASGEVPPIADKTSIVKSVDNQNTNIPRFCRNCGASLSEGAMFCRSCGKKI